MDYDCSIGDKGFGRKPFLHYFVKNGITVYSYGGVTPLKAIGKVSAKSMEELLEVPTSGVKTIRHKTEATLVVPEGVIIRLNGNPSDEGFREKHLKKHVSSQGGGL